MSLSASGSAPEVKFDLPIASGPFEPTWESIEKNYPGTPAWLREAKFGIWVHFGPQAAGESGDWYARNLYKPGHAAYKNHLARRGHPAEVGYKEVLRDWNPSKLDPAALAELYREAGARFLFVQGVHHDQYDMWDSRYQPWNSTRLGAKRDLVGEWARAAAPTNCALASPSTTNTAGGGGRPPSCPTTAASPWRTGWANGGRAWIPACSTVSTSANTPASRRPPSRTGTRRPPVSSDATPTMPNGMPPGGPCA